MSRDYHEYCSECGRYNARRGFVSSTELVTKEVLQCLDCGACCVFITSRKKLKTHGTNEAAWKEAVLEVKK